MTCTGIWVGGLCPLLVVDKSAQRPSVRDDIEPQFVSFLSILADYFCLICANVGASLRLTGPLAGMEATLALLKDQVCLPAHRTQTLHRNTRRIFSASANVSRTSWFNF